MSKPNETYSPTPIVIVVGFLGAGKTTFLRELLPLLESHELDPFVVINDYSNAKVDASSLRQEGRSVTPINGNCICCDSLFELMNVLLEVERTENRVVLVEANGTTDPPVLLEHLLVNPELRRRFSPILQVAVVDLERWQKRGEHNDLEYRQVESASHLLFTRKDTVSSERFTYVREDIEWFNPKARHINCRDFARDLKMQVIQSGDLTKQEIDIDSRRHSSKHEHDCHQLSHSFVGMEIKLPDPMSAAHLHHWLRSLPMNVLRVKGVVRLEEIPQKWQQFQRLDTTSSEITMYPLDQEPTVPACAVLIGVGLDEAAVRDSLHSLTKGS